MDSWVRQPPLPNTCPPSKASAGNILAWSHVGFPAAVPPPRIGRKWRARLLSAPRALSKPLPPSRRTVSRWGWWGWWGMERVGGGGDCCGSSSADPRSTFVLSNLAEVVERVFTFLPAKALLRVAGWGQRRREADLGTWLGLAWAGGWADTVGTQGWPRLRTPCPQVALPYPCTPAVVLPGTLPRGASFPLRFSPPPALPPNRC